MKPPALTRRCRALERRGLSRKLADDLWQAGDLSLLADVEGCSDEQLRDLSRLAVDTDAATRSNPAPDVEGC